MAQYKFVTIVAPEQVRADFTYLRGVLGTTDKQLMQAFWNLGEKFHEELKQEVISLKEIAINLKEIKDISQWEKPTPVAKAAKGIKPKKPKKEEIDEEVIYDDVEEEEEFEVLVVDGLE